VFAPDSYNFCDFVRKGTPFYDQAMVVINTVEVCAKITCLYAGTQENREFVYLNKIFGWKSFLLIILSF